MEPSYTEEVISLYLDADEYSEVMDKEVLGELYTLALNSMSLFLKKSSKPLLDTACGTGQFLNEYYEKYDKNRALVGIDLSPKMLNKAKEVTKGVAELYIGNMCNLTMINDGAMAGVVNFFAIQHINEHELPIAINEWQRVLEDGGKLILAGWNGNGTIDYGGESSIKAYLYNELLLKVILEDFGFDVAECRVIQRPTPEIPMDAFYLEAIKTI